MKFNSSSSKILFVKDYTDIYQIDTILNKEEPVFAHGRQIINYCLDRDVIYIMDEDLYLTRFDLKTGKVSSSDISTLARYPELAKEYKPFDMGYAYPMKAKNNMVCIVSDLGLFIIDTVEIQ